MLISHANSLKKGEMDAIKRRELSHFQPVSHFILDHIFPHVYVSDCRVLVMFNHPPNSRFVWVVCSFVILSTGEPNESLNL